MLATQLHPAPRLPATDVTPLWVVVALSVEAHTQLETSREAHALARSSDMQQLSRDRRKSQYYRLQACTRCWPMQHTQCTLSRAVMASHTAALRAIAVGMLRVGNAGHVVLRSGRVPTHSSAWAARTFATSSGDGDAGSQPSSCGTTPGKAAPSLDVEQITGDLTDSDDEDINVVDPDTGEVGGPTRGGTRPEPTRYGDWQIGGRTSDF